jgi:hypothetical protein
MWRLHRESSEMECVRSVCWELKIPELQDLASIDGASTVVQHLFLPLGMVDFLLGLHFVTRALWVRCCELR